VTDNHNRKNVWDNPSLKDQKSIEESLISGWPINYPRPKSELTEKAMKSLLELLKKDPVMVIDLNTLRLRPPKYK